MWVSHTHLGSETSVDLTFKTARGVARYKLSSEKAFNPITQQPFKDFSLPRTLLETGRAGS